MSPSAAECTRIFILLIPILIEIRNKRCGTASWQWYDRGKLAKPSALDYDKVTRVNFAFFQSDEHGNIWGTDEWADVSPRPPNSSFASPPKKSLDSTLISRLSALVDTRNLVRFVSLCYPCGETTTSPGYSTATWTSVRGSARPANPNAGARG